MTTSAVEHHRAPSARKQLLLMYHDFENENIRVIRYVVHDGHKSGVGRRMVLKKGRGQHSSNARDAKFGELSILWA